MKRQLAVIIGTLFSLGAQGATLLDVYLDAQRNDSQFAAARAQLAAGQEKYPQARAGLLPNVNFTGATTYNQAEIEQPLQREPHYNSNSWQLQLTQPLFRWQNWVSAKQGSLQVGIAEAQFEAAKSDLIVRTAQAYFDVLLAEDTLSAVRALKLATEEQLQLAKKSFEVGTVTVTDVNEAQSRYDLVVAQEIAADSDLAVKRHALRILIGKEPEALARLREGVNVMGPQPADMNEWVRAAEQSNPLVQAQRLTTELAQKEVERARAGHLPTLDMVASYGHNYSGSSGTAGTVSETNAKAIGLQLTVPVFQGGATQSRVREALALSDKAKSDLETATRNAAQASRQAYLGVTNGLAQVRGYEAAMVSGRSSLESNKLGYEVGVRINIDVLNAQTQLADTYTKLAKARYDAILAQFRLKSAAGSLSVEDVRSVNDLLQR